MSTRIFVVCLLLTSWAPVSGPLQLISYAGPPILVVLGLLAGAIRIAALDALFLGLGTAAAGVYSALFSDTGLASPCLALLTHSSLLILIIRLPDRRGNLVWFLISVTSWFSAVEFVIGCLQGVAAGGEFSDNVKGTLQGSQSHPYALKMLFQGLFLAYMWQHARRYHVKFPKPWLVVLGTTTALLGAILASFLSGTILFVIGVGAVGGWSALQEIRKGRVKVLRDLVVVLALVGTLTGFYILTEPTLLDVTAFAVTEMNEGGVSEGGRFQKYQVFGLSIREVLMDGPWKMLFGIGLGRYSSRAALMLSGEYLPYQPSWLPTVRSPEMEQYILGNWNRQISERLGNSTQGMPFNSLQSLLIELGIVGCGSLLVYLLSFSWRTSRRLKNHPGLEQTLSGGLARVIPYMIAALLSIGLSDVWLEFSVVTVFVYLVMATGMSVTGSPLATQACPPSPDSSRKPS